MDLINKNFIKFKNNSIELKRENNTLRLINDSDHHGFFLCPKIFNPKKIKSVFIDFKGEILRGNGAILQILGTDRSILSETSFNSCSTYSTNLKRFFFTIKIMAHSEIIITKADVALSKKSVDVFSIFKKR